jgi:hypothetical protein
MSKLLVDYNRSKYDGNLTMRQFFIAKLLLLRRFSRFRQFTSQFFQAWYDLPFPPTHYYSPLPDLPTVRKHFSRWYRESEMPGITMRWESQRALLEDLKRYVLDFSALSPYTQIQDAGFGLGYGEIEAIVLYAMIRRFQTRQIIEVGSGVSSWFAWQGLENNRQIGIDGTGITCIEPFPTPPLVEMDSHGQIVLHRAEVQDIPADLFLQLAPGDILFIDSTHVDKTDSDVPYLYLEILPRLRPGVLVHIHDIAFPFRTFPPQHPIFMQSVLWNESALVQALLMDNDTFEILMCQSALHHIHPDWLQAAIPTYDPSRHFPASLWIRKIK